MMNIIFCGSAEFSMPSMEYLYNNYHLTGIVTQPDKPQGRGLKIRFSRIKNFALTHKIKLFQPDNLKKESFIQSLSELMPDFVIAVSYGKIFPENLIRIPKYHSINIHPSLLPGYKGPSPIQWVLINGEEHTGVSSHVIDESIDSGKIIYQLNLKISPIDNYDDLYQGLSVLAVEVLKESIEPAKKDHFIFPEDIYKIKNFYARKLEKEDLFIKWEKSSLEINNLIRGLSSSPGSCTYYNHELIKIFKSKIIEETSFHSSAVPGQVLHADIKNGIVIKTGDGVLQLLELQRENKKKLNYQDFINGMHLKPDEVFKNVKP